MNQKEKLSKADTNALFQQAFALHQSGNIINAIEIYHQLLTLFPTNVQILFLFGTAESQRGNFLYSISLFERLLAVAPNNVEAYNNRGNALYEIKRAEEALQSYDRAIQLKPDYVEAHNNRGNALKELKRTDEALQSYDRAIQLKPDYARAYSNRGGALQELKRPDEALQSYDRAIQLKPDYVEAYYNRGNALLELKRPDEALQSYDRAIQLKPDYVGAHNNRGNALKELKRLDEALQSCDRAIQLKPDYVEAYINRGNALQEFKRPDEALQSYDRAIQVKPDYVEAYSNKGILLQQMRFLEESLKCFNKALVFDHDYVIASLGKSETLLLMGEYSQGWHLAEWRWKSEFRSEIKYKEPLWLGRESLSGKTILVHSEAGFGDSLMLARYLPMVNQLGANVIVLTEASLIKILSTLDGVYEFIKIGDALPKFDYHCPMMSLPLAFGTTVESIPSNIPYLHADKNKTKDWRYKLGDKERVRIGLIWAGRSRGIDNKPIRKRNVNFELLAPLFDLPIEFHVLQKEIPPSDFLLLANHPAIRHHVGDIHDFADTAALIEEVDLVLTIDTSVAHLAGALGKAFWVMLPYAVDYRWMQDGNKTPWYPNATLFRQFQIGDWEGVIREVRSGLEAMI